MLKVLLLITLIHPDGSLHDHVDVYLSMEDCKRAAAEAMLLDHVYRVHCVDTTKTRPRKKKLYLG